MKSSTQLRNGFSICLTKGGFCYAIFSDIAFLLDYASIYSGKGPEGDNDNARVGSFSPDLPCKIPWNQEKAKDIHNYRS